MHYLVTGGLGYIGGHMAILLHSEGHKVTVFDNLSNSSTLALERIQEICDYKIKFFQVDISDKEALHTAFSRATTDNAFDVVFHFAGTKSKLNNDEFHFENSTNGAITLLDAMDKFEVFNLIFSSSAEIYRKSNSLPITEDSEIKSFDCHSESIIACEALMKSLTAKNKQWKIATLRYFNVVGAHESGLFGESPSKNQNTKKTNYIHTSFDTIYNNGKDNKFNHLSVFPNKDSSLDYIHVMDLVEGHYAAAKNLNNQNGYDFFNLSSGVEYSVKDIISSICKNIQCAVFSAQKSPTKSINKFLLSPKKAFNKLNWQTTRNLDEMILDHYRWQKNRIQSKNL